MNNQNNNEPAPKETEATILIVDDTPANLRLIVDYLGDCNYTLLVATCGEGALKRFDYVLPDLVLLDVMMPGLNGFEVCDKMKENEKTRDIPVIFMTALTTSEDKIKGFNAGAVDFITKPVQQEELKSRVKTHLTICKHRELLEREVQKQTLELQEQMSALSHEITERKQAEKELLTLRNYLVNVIDSMPSIIIGVDPDCIITQWNSHAEQATGCSASDAIGNSLCAVVPRLCSEIESIRDAILKREVRTTHKHTYIEDEHIYYEDITIYPLVSDNETGAVIRIDHITERVQMEELMVQSEKMRSIAGLAAGMAHEINNPLSVITQGVQNITRRLDPGLQKNIEVALKYDVDLEKLKGFLDERRIFSFLDNSQQAVERAAGIVKNMLMFSRKSDSQHCLVDMRNVIENAIALGSSDYDMRKRYDFKFVDIIKEYDPDLPPVNCCASEIEQVLLNLFKNALQAMEDITIEGHKPLFHVRLFKEESKVHIEIEDNGPGMDENVRTRIFEPFFTTKPVGVGTGLGLSVSYMIITQNHGGTFEVESELGHGTKFIIHLPLSKIDSKSSASL